MAGEYRITLPKTDLGGFSESPQQDIGNAGSPFLSKSLKVKDAIVGGAAFMYGKKVVSSGLKATVGQLGIAEVERALDDVQQLAIYGGLALVKPGIAALAIGSDMIVAAIDRTVYNHNTNLDNIRIVEERGTRRKMNAGGFYA